MKGMPFNLQGTKGVFEVSEISSIFWNKEGCSLGSEPTSVLDTRRSPSSPTSSSTLSSSLGGGSGSTDTAGVAAVSGNPPQKWPLTKQDSSAAVADPPGSGGGAAGAGGLGNRKDEWTSELQPIPTALGIVSGGVGFPTGPEKCTGLGMEDWESMLSETESSQSQDQSLLGWIMSDDPSLGLKQLLQSVGPSDFEGNAGFGIVDPDFGFEPFGGGSGSAMNVSLGGAGAGAVSPSLAVPASGFPPNNGRVGSNSIPNPTSLPNYNKIASFGSNNGNRSNSVLSPSSKNLPLSNPFHPGVFYQPQQHQQLELTDEKPQLLNPQILINHQQNHPTQNQTVFMPLSFAQQDQHLLLPPQAKRHHPGIGDPGFQIPNLPFVDSGPELFLRRQQQQQQGFPHQLQLRPDYLQHAPIMAAKPKVVEAGDEVAQHQQQQLQVLVDHLFKAAELVKNGNLVHARGILARLNHQLSPGGRPLQRAAFYFKEALQLLLLNNNNVQVPSRISTPLDVLLKIDSYKAFSEISPILQFTNFTCNQVLLEALDSFNHIHIIDFDIGLGEQWASFMQEIAGRVGGAPSFMITAFTCSSSHAHPLELALARENLSHFANDLGIKFALEIVSLDSFDPASWSLPLHVSESEAIAVNLPVGSSSNHPSSFPLLLRLVKQLSPKIVVSVDRGCDRDDLPFSHHFLHTLQTYSILLDSIDAMNRSSDTVNKIERFLLQPRIDSVMKRHLAYDKMPPWRALFASAGFSPSTFSNFTETQAECMVKRLQVRGFHVEKRQASLMLCWQQRELVMVSAWSC